MRASTPLLNPPWRLGAVVLALAVLASCGSRDDGGGATLRADTVGGGGAAEALLRQSALDATAQGLVQFDAAGRTVPGLATSWRFADDGLSVIFRLRAAKWSDGRPVTAEQVVLSFRRLLAPASRSPLKPLFGRIVNAPQVANGRLAPRALGISAPVANVVEIRLSAPTPELLQLLALPDATVRRSGRDAPVGGAFVTEEGAPASATQQRLVRNPDFHDAASVKLGALHLTATADVTAAVARFTRNAADIVTGGGIGSLGEVRTLTKPAVLHVEPVRGVYGYAANVRDGPLADVRVRTALAMAIDREALVRQQFTADEIAPLAAMLPDTLVAAPVQPGWSQISMEQRRDAARALLADAGHDATHPLTITLRLPAGRGHARLAAALAADWAPLGVVAQPQPASDADHARALARGDFDLAVIERASPVDTPWALLEALGCGARTGGYCNRSVDALVARALAARDPAQRAAALAEAQALLLIDMPMIPLLVPVRWSLVGADVGGWTDNPGGHHPLARLTKTPRRRLIN